MYALFSSPIFVILLVCVFIKTIKGGIRELLNKYFILLIVIVVSILFAVLVAYTARQQLTIVHVFSFIIVCCEWRRYVAQKTSIKRAVCFLLLLLSVTLYIPVHSLRRDFCKAYYTFANQCRQASSDAPVIASEMEKINAQYYSHRIFNNYVALFSFIGWNYGKQMFSMSITGGKSNTHVSNVLPRSVEQIASECTSETKVAPSLFRLNDGYCIFVSTDSLKKEDVAIVGLKKTQFIFNSVTEGIFTVTEMFGYGDKYYYVFSNSPLIERIDTLMVRK